MDSNRSLSLLPWPALLVTYERVLAAAEVFDDVALVAVEAELRRRLRATHARGQREIATAVRGIEQRVLGWHSPTLSRDEAAPELRALGFSEAAIVESRHLR